MASEKYGWDEILADLEAKRAAMDAAIAALRAAQALGALGRPTDIEMTGAFLGPTSTANPVELPTGALLGKSLPAAIKLYLSAVKKKQTIREIASALKEGGVESTSDNFENIVTGALNRLRVAGDVLRFKDGWGLAEFYPESLRNRISQETKPKAKKSASKPAKRVKPRKGARGSKAPKGPSMDDRVLEFLRSQPSTAWLPSAAALAMRMSEENNGPFNLAIARLIRYGKIERNANGSIRAYKGPLTIEPAAAAG